MAGLRFEKEAFETMRGHAQDRTCPVCRSSASRNSEAFPFCSRQCKLVDLGKWLTGNYALKGPPMDGLGIDDDGPWQRDGRA